jgi:F-type H+-transporting ATPase subunit gamma
VANLKAIRKRISSVKATQKITRAMKMVAGARLNRAQMRITAMRPYAVTTGRVLREVIGQTVGEGDFQHPLLSVREEKRSLYLVITGDRGLCGSFNTNLNKRGEQEWKRAKDDGRDIQFALIGRKGRDYFRRRNAPIYHVFEGVWDKLSPEIAREVARTVVKPFLKGEVDAVYLVYSEFKSAMSQNVVQERLFPLQLPAHTEVDSGTVSEFIFEPDRKALLEHLVPTYVEVTVLRALYESRASQLGAQMTAMDAATKNASEMIGSLTLKYNRARQAAITTEILEIIGGAEALQAG